MWDNTKQYGFFIKVKGTRVTEYSHTDGYTYIEGRVNSEYELELVNDSYERVLMVPSVDGLSVMDSKDAGLHSSGYILSPRSKMTVPGWRVDGDNVAKFVFSSAKDSYTKLKSNITTNVGALGLMVFREKIDHFVFSSNYNMNNTWCGGSITRSGIGNTTPGSGPVAGGSGSGPVAGGSTTSVKSVSSENTTPLGTGFGNRQQFETVKISFNKRDDNNPDAIITMFYDSAKGLEKKGIDIAYRTKQRPEAFPTYNTTSDGCWVPPGWDTDNDESKIRNSFLNNLLSLIDDNHHDQIKSMLRYVPTDKLQEAFNEYRNILNI